MSTQLFQFQFEVSNGITIPAKFLSSLLKICGEDDIQPIAIAPLELFGDWLMVDSRRINDGVAALERRQSAAWKPLLLISPPKSSKLVSDNIRLTSAFLFAICCSVIFDVQKTTEVIYEIMIIGGAAQRYNITSNVVFRFIELLNGYREFFVIPQGTPYDVYESLGRDTLRHMREENIWVSNLYQQLDTKLLAKLLYRTLETLRNAEFECIELEGSIGGLWIAFVFVWLRPTETAVLLASVRVYPENLTQTQEEEFKPRLIIRFQSNPGRSINRVIVDDWNISTWKATGRVTEVIRFYDDHEQAGPNPLTSSPWMNARYQIELINHSLPVVNAIGHLAGALVQVVTECASLWNEDFGQERSFLDICSPWYLEGYTTIMKQLGWGDLNIDYQKRIASIIKIKIKKGVNNLSNNNAKTIESLIESCFVDYEKSYNESLIVSDGDHMQHIVDYAVHLAAHAIVSSVYRERPQHLTYWPLEPQLLAQQYQLIREMLLDYERGDRLVRKGVSFESLRRRAIKSAIPSVTDIGPDDLAWAGDGYVAFSSALAHEVWTDHGNGRRVMIDRSIDLTNPRLIGTIEVFPGCLQQKDVPGSCLRVSEDRKQFKFAARILQPLVAVDLFEDDVFKGTLENRAYHDSNTEVKYFLRREDRTGTLFLTTNLEVQEKLDVKSQSPVLLQPILQLIPTSWHNSIDVTMFANHICENTSTQPQLKALAKVWRGKGISIHWCHIGALQVLNATRYIMTTARKKESRFFEAGNVPKDCKVFVRQGLVPLTHCIKVAMENCESDPKWIIIA